MANIYLFSEAAKRSKAGQQMFSIQDIISSMAAVTLKNLLFIHSWSGCDTTSATFGQGKGLILKKMSSSQELSGVKSTVL